MGNTACTEADTAYLGSASELNRAFDAYVRAESGSASDASGTTTGRAAGGTNGNTVSSSGYYHALKAVTFTLDRHSGTVKVQTLPLCREAAAAVAAQEKQTLSALSNASISSPYSPGHGGYAQTPRTTGASARSTGGGLTRRTPTSALSSVTPRPGRALFSSNPYARDVGDITPTHQRNPSFVPPLDEQSAVVIVHISRRIVGGSVPPAEEARATEEGAAIGSALRSAFTPRGLSETFSMDLSDLRWRAAHNSPGAEVYETAVYTFNGRRAHPLVIATATTSAIDVERLTVHDMGFSRYLFHNGATPPARDTGLPPLYACDPSEALGIVASPRLPDIATVAQHVHVLRSLFPRASSRGSIADPPQVTQHLAAMTSARATGARTAPSDLQPGTRNPNANGSASTATTPIAPVSARGSMPTLRFNTTATHRDSNASSGGHAMTARASTGHTPTSDTGRSSGEGVESDAVLTGESARSGAAAANPNANASTTSVPSFSARPGVPRVNLSFAANAIPAANSGSGTGSQARPSGLKQPSAMPTIKLPQPGVQQQQQHHTQQQETGTSWGTHASSYDDDPQRERENRLRESAPVATEVLPYLYVGGELPAADRAQLVGKRITHIVNCANIVLPNKFPDLFEYLSLPLCDSPDEPIFDLFQMVVGLIDLSFAMGGRTFVHCHQGVSRSCSFVIAYVMWKQGLCYDAAYALVRQHRKVCSPNPGFMVNLLNWQRRLQSPDPVVLFRFGPYSVDYPTPYLFSDLKLLGSAHGSGEPDPAVRSLDPRHVYLLVTTADDAANALLLVGDHVAQDVVDAARDAARTALLYGFYGNKPSLSENRAGDTVRFETCAVPHETTRAPTPAVAFSAESGVAPLEESLRPFNRAFAKARAQKGKPNDTEIFTGGVAVSDALSAFHTPETLDAFREAVSAKKINARHARRRRRCREAVFAGKPIPSEFSDEDDDGGIRSPASQQAQSQTQAPPVNARRRETSDGSPAPSAANTPPVPNDSTASSSSNVALHPTARAVAIRTPEAPLSRDASHGSASGSASGANSLGGAPAGGRPKVPPLGGGKPVVPPLSKTPSNTSNETSPPAVQAAAVMSDDYDDELDGELPEAILHDRLVVFAGPHWSELVELPEFEDLAPDDCIAAFVRPRNAEHAPELYLWIGSEYPGPEGFDDDVAQAEGLDIAGAAVAAFERLCADPQASGIVGRLRRSAQFRRTDVTVIHEDAEPDEFIAAFD